MTGVNEKSDEKQERNRTKKETTAIKKEDESRDQEGRGVVGFVERGQDEGKAKKGADQKRNGERGERVTRY